MKQIHIDWMLSQGVAASTIIFPTAIAVAHGERGADGIFEPMDEGPPWLAFEEEHDIVYWLPKTGEIATESGHAFALGAGCISNPASTALDNRLHIFGDPLSWLQASRNGIVVIKWQWAFEHLRDVTRIAVAEPMLATYRKWMRPKLPQLAVIPATERQVA